MSSRGFVSIDPQIEIFEYGKGVDRQILLSPDATYRIKHPHFLKSRYQINSAAKEIFLLMDGSKTLEDIEICLVGKFPDEDFDSIRRYLFAFEQMLKSFEEIKMVFSDARLSKPVTYLQFDSVYPSVVSLEVTNQCNLRCRHCYGDFGGNRHKSEISDTVLEHLFASFHDIGVTTVEITGGDPSVYPHTAKAIDTAFSHGITNVTYLSNGVILPPDVLSSLAKHKDNVLAQIDLHSADDDYNEWFTGVSGVVEKVKSTILRLVEADISVFVTTIVTPGNIDELVNIAKWAYDSGADMFSLSPIIELGRAYGESKDLLLSTQGEIEKFNRIIVEIDGRYPGFLKKPRDIKDLGRTNCGAILPHVTIDSRGYIKICPMDSLPEFGQSLGNVFDEDIKDLFDRHSEFIKAFTDLVPPDASGEKCSSCRHAVFCHTCIARGLLVAQNESLSCAWYKSVPSVIKTTLGLRE